MYVTFAATSMTPHKAILIVVYLLARRSKVFLPIGLAPSVA